MNISFSHHAGDTGKALGCIRAGGDGLSFLVHPAALDSAFQLGAAMPAPEGAAPGVCMGLGPAGISCQCHHTSPCIQFVCASIPTSDISSQSPLLIMDGYQR